MTKLLDNPLADVNLSGYFSDKYGEKLKGHRNWQAVISPEDRKALAHVAFACSGYGRNGGRARAASAFRDEQGRFVSKARAERMMYEDMCSLVGKGVIAVLETHVSSSDGEYELYNKGDVFANDGETLSFLAMANDDMPRRVRFITADKAPVALVYDKDSHECVSGHSFSCIASITKHALELSKWLCAWPNTCRKCFGWGYHEYRHDPSPQGVSLGSGYMTDADPCRCIEQGCCPRCGEQAWLDSDFDRNPVTCPFCDWREDAPEGMPNHDGCYCHENFWVY